MAGRKLAGALSEFGGHETHGVSRLPSSRLHAASDGLGWTCLYASVHTATSYEGSFAGRPDALIELWLAGSASIIRRIRGQSMRRRTEPGLFGTVPPTIDFNIALEGEITALHVYVRKFVIDEVASDFVSGDPRVVEIIPEFGAVDKVVERLALAAREGLDDPPHLAGLYTDHLARALAARLLRDHSNVPALAFKYLPPSGLRPSVLNNVKDLIEARVDGHLSLMELAAGSGLSAGHFARQFKRSTGLSPYQYVLRARIGRAQRLLAERSTPIAEIALACGFADQEHLTKVFKRLTGATPAAYRNDRRT